METNNGFVAEKTSTESASETIKPKPKRVTAKECKVLYWNKHSKNFAFLFDGQKVQIRLSAPLITCGDTVKIKLIDGKYELMD